MFRERYDLTTRQTTGFVAGQLRCSPRPCPKHLQLVTLTAVSYLGFCRLARFLAIVPEFRILLLQQVCQVRVICVKSHVQYLTCLLTHICRNTNACFFSQTRHRPMVVGLVTTWMQANNDSCYMCMLSLQLKVGGLLHHHVVQSGKAL